MGQPANKALLDALNQSHGWFHAKKARPIWAKRLERDQSVETLEGTAVARAGDFLCRGEANDCWPQDSKSLEANYIATDTIDEASWRQYEPRSEAEGVLALQIHRSFELVTKRGALVGKAGDYLVKNYRDRSVPYPDDIWIVDQKLFRMSYRPVE